MGYQPGTKSFHLWRICDQKVILHWDVIFDENISNYPGTSEPTMPLYIEDEIKELNEQLEGPKEIPDQTNEDKEPETTPLHTPTHITPLSFHPAAPPPTPHPQRTQQLPAWCQVDKENQLPEEAFQKYTGITPDNEEFRPDFQLLACINNAATDLAQAEHTNFALSALALTSASTSADPMNLKDALSHPDANEWRASIEEECTALTKKEVFKSLRISDLPKGTKLLQGKLVFKQKLDAQGKPERKKMRCVAQGFRQIPGINYHDTYSLVTKISSICLICAIAAAYNLELEQLNVKTAYLNAHLDETIYMAPPDGICSSPDEVWLLLCALYGLKQSGKIWNDLIDKTFCDLDFKPCMGDPCVYVYNKDGTIMFIPLYVDNSLCAHNNPTFFQHIISKLKKHFEMSYLGPAHFMLGIEIIWDWKKGTITLNQQQYILDMLEKYGMSNCHTCPTPMTPKMELTTAQSPQTDAECTEAKTIPYQNVTGSLLYATMATQPDIAFAVGVLCCFSSNHRQTHWTAAK